MTPTSDERREVAERLREYDGWVVILDNCALEYSVGLTAGDLADLIDPVCHNRHPRASDGCFCCSECLFLYEPTDRSACRNSFLYCPRCGARLVDDDD